MDFSIKNDDNHGRLPSFAIRDNLERLFFDYGVGCNTIVGCHLEEV